MRRYFLAAMVSATTLAGAAVIPLTGSAAAASKMTTLRYFFKIAAVTFKTSSGQDVGHAAAPKVGDEYVVTVDAYTGTGAHHSAKIGATASLSCVVIKVIDPNKNVPSICTGTVAIGNSMLISVSRQNLAINDFLYPITTGTGNFAHARGFLRTTNLPHSTNANAVLSYHT
jgi:hypothetical protein